MEPGPLGVFALSSVYLMTMTRTRSYTHWHHDFNRRGGLRAHM